MASAFGFPSYPQSPTPDPRRVGQALARAPSLRQPMPTAGPLADNAPPVTTELRRTAAFYTSGGGQSGTGSAPAGDPNYPVDETQHHSAMNAAIGAALTRLGNGVMAPPDLSPARAAKRRADLLRLGISPFEAELLGRTGGI